MQNSKTILVIEDNREIRENITEILELSGYIVVEAKNGKIGIQKIREKRPDLIICDVMMPEVDGFGVLTILNKDPRTAIIPLIFLTAKGDQKDFRMGMRLGADDYIVKPFERVDLLEAVELRLRKSELLKNCFEGNNNELPMFIRERYQSKNLELLNSEGQTKRFEPGEIICQAGDQPAYLYFVASGEVMSKRIPPLGEEVVLATLGPGSLFGYFPLLQNRSFDRTWMARSRAEISFIAKDDFFSMLFDNRTFLVRFLEKLADDFKALEDQLLGYSQ